jgi:transcriptional regulator with XRE-family HTH domain
MDPKRNFGARLRLLRAKKGWSQQPLAAEATLDRTYIGGIERGERNPSLVHIHRSARTLDGSSVRLAGTTWASAACIPRAKPHGMPRGCITRCEASDAFALPFRRSAVPTTLEK